MANYDCTKGEPINLEAADEARRFGLNPISVHCDEPGAQVGDDVGVSFFAFVHFTPRIGEVIQIEGGTMCRVKEVIHRTVASEAFDGVTMIPTIFAVRVEIPDEDLESCDGA